MSLNLPSGVKDNSLIQQLWSSTLWWRASVLWLKSVIPGISGISGMGSGGSWTSASSGVLGPTGVMDPEYEDPSLGVRTIKFSSIWMYRLGHRYPNIISDSSIMWGGKDLSDHRLKVTFIVKLLYTSFVWLAEIVIQNVINRPPSM